jgi:hypothetical protein
MQISPEIEANIVNEARKQGISVDSLLRQLFTEPAAEKPSSSSAKQLPAWDLGSIGSLHRRDLYDDAP